LKLDFIKQLQEIEELELKDSGFSLNNSLYWLDILLNINKYTPLGASSYIPLPLNIENRKATINIENNDDKCFKYSMLTKFVNPRNSRRVASNYLDIEHNYDFSNLTYPVQLTDIRKFEKIIRACQLMYLV